MTENKTLYEISYEIQEFVNKVDECPVIDGRFVDAESGEVVGTTEELNALSMEHDKKVENCLYVMKNYDYEVSSVDGEIDYLQGVLDAAKKKKKSILNRKEWFKQYLLFCLNNKSWKSKDKDVHVSCVVRGNDSCVVTDLNSVPSEFIKPHKITEDDVMKNEIKKAIKDGAKVSGVEIKKTYSLIVK